MTPTKVIRAQRGGSYIAKWLPDHKYGLNCPFLHPGPAKITPEIAHSALSGDPTAVTLVANHSFLIKFLQIKLSGLKRGFLHHKVVPRPQMRTEFAKKRPAKISPQNRGNPTSQSGSPTTKTACIGQKMSNIIPKISRSALSGNPTGVTSATTTLFSLNDPKICYRAQKGILTPQIGSSATKVA